FPLKLSARASAEKAARIPQMVSTFRIVRCPWVESGRGGAGDTGRAGSPGWRPDLSLNLDHVHFERVGAFHHATDFGIDGAGRRPGRVGRAFRTAFHGFRSFCIAGGVEPVHLTAYIE